MALLIKELNEICADEWNSFCERDANAWAHHVGMSLLEGIKNISFAVVENGEIVAVCPLTVEKKMLDEREFNLGSLFNMSMPGPVISDNAQGEKYMKQINGVINEHLRLRAAEEKIAKVAFNLSHYYYNDGQGEFLRHEMSRHGFLDVSLKMVLLDLRAGEDELWRNLSKGHRSELKKNMNNGACLFTARDTLAPDFNAFIENIAPYFTGLQSSCSEINVRYLHALFKQGKIELCRFVQGEKTTGAALYLKHGRTVQYFSADTFAKQDIPVHHLIIWESIKKFKNEGYHILDMGVFAYDSQLNYIPSDKAKAISMFKRGFGGRIRPFVIMEKYFDPEYFEQEYSRRTASYKETINGRKSV